MRRRFDKRESYGTADPETYIKGLAREVGIACDAYFARKGMPSYKWTDRPWTERNARHVDPEAIGGHARAPAEGTPTPGGGQKSNRSH